MALLPLLFDDFYSDVNPAPRRNWLSLQLPWEENQHPLRHVLNQLIQVGKDNSITIDKDQFQANIDVQQFKPDEITVKLDGDRTVIVEGKHEEKQDEHGFISRHFVRRYVLPEDCDVQKLQSKLSSDGVLSLSAPKIPEGKQVEGKVIPISLTGPIRGVEQKQTEIEVKKAA